MLYSNSKVMPPLYGEDFVLNEKLEINFWSRYIFYVSASFFCDKIFIIFSEYDIILMYFY